MGFFKCLKTKPQMRKALGVLFFSVCTLPAVALDLGRLQVLSAIGEPLLAEIDVVQASPDELRTLRAQLAAPSAFSQAGMEYNPALSRVTPGAPAPGATAAFGARCHHARRRRQPGPPV